MILQPDVVIKNKAVQVPGKKGDKMAIAFVLITNGVQQCHVRFALRQYTKDTTAYDGALFQVMEVMDTSDTENVMERRREHQYCGIASCLYLGGSRIGSTIVR